MIVVIAKFDIRPGQRDKLLAVAKPCIEATRRENGCISYELFSSVEDESAMVFVERWRDLDALRAHQQSAHIARFKEERASYVEGPSRVTVFEAEEVAL